MHYSMHEHALRLARICGFCVFPLRDRGKKPRIKKWQIEATTEAAKISEWWSQWPNANIGVATGSKSKLFVIDVDVKSGGIESLEDLKVRFPGFAETLQSRTGSGGYHLYFSYDGTPLIRNSVSLVAPGSDVRGEGGYVVAPPSLHENGSRYEWIDWI